MKYYIRISFILCAALGTFTHSNAQDDQPENAAAPIESAVPEEDVQVAFRKMPEAELLGGVSVVNVAELIEKNYSTYSLDNLQAFVGGWTGNSIWGMDELLVLVDGVPRDASNVMPTEIHQITFLKSASAVLLYGSRAAKGVIYITTKRGAAAPLNVTVRANTGYHVAKSYPKYLGSAEYMTLYNEALANDGASPLYGEEEIYHSASGLNPYRYPDVDFYSSEYLKKAFNRSDVTAEFSAGNEKSRFYTNLGYIRANDIFKFGEAQNNFTDRLNIRGNIDLAITEMISAYVNANATFYNASTANATASDNANDYWTYSATMRPNRLSPLIPLSFLDPNDLASQELLAGGSNLIDGKYFLGGSQTDMTNIFADYYASGKSKWTSRQFQFDAGLNFNLDKVLKGLSLHTQYGVDYSTSYVTSYNNSYAVYQPTWNNYNGQDVVSIQPDDRFGKDQKSGVQNIAGSSNRQTIAFSSYLNYLTTVNDSHNILARIVATGFQQTQTQVYHRTGNANLGVMLNYNYKNKYYADLATALVHSAKLAEGNRTGLSSSATLGWRLSEEGALKNSSAIDNLVISASASVLKTDLDIRDGGQEHYLSEANYTQASGAWWGWRDGASERSTNSLRGANEDLTFINRKEVSANVGISLWDKLVTANATFFVNKMEGLIIQPTTLYPSYFSTFFPSSSFMPYENYNDLQRRGIDFTVNVNKQVGDVGLSLGLAGMYYSTKALRLDENFEDEYRNRTGKPLYGIWGLESAGLFQTQEEIDNSPRQKFGGTIRPGDIKYVDQNNDGVVDERDEVFLGKGGAFGGPFTGGVNLTARWKGFTLFALGTFDMGANRLKNNSYFWVYGNRKYSEVVRDRWTEETSETATYPRLTAESGVNNFRSSDFWMYKANRFNLARVQLSYSLPSGLISDTFLRDVSIYVSGSNLLTLSKEREILEMNITSAPQTRFYNLGVRAAF